LAELSAGWPPLPFHRAHSLKENTAIYVGSLDSKEIKRILTEQSNAVYAPPGYPVFSREGSVMAQPFNLSKMEVAT
jgi:hypothetical protein